MSLPKQRAFKVRISADNAQSILHDIRMKPVIVRASGTIIPSDWGYWGLRVHSVTPGSAAQKFGIQSDNVILKMYDGDNEVYDKEKRHTGGHVEADRFLSTIAQMHPLTIIISARSTP